MESIRFQQSSNECRHHKKARYCVLKIDFSLSTAKPIRKGKQYRSAMMEDQTSSKEISSTRNHQKIDIQWSLRPLSIWAALLGFELGLHRRGNTAIRLIIYGLGFVLFLANLWVNLESVGYAYWNRLVTKELNKKQDTTTYIKVLSGFTADAFFSTGLPSIFFVYCLFSRRWKQVRDQIFYIQREMNLSEKFHREYRKHCYEMIFILPVVVSFETKKHVISLSFFY